MSLRRVLILAALVLVGAIGPVAHAAPRDSRRAPEPDVMASTQSRPSLPGAETAQEKDKKPAPRPRPTPGPVEGGDGDR